MKILYTLLLLLICTTAHAQHDRLESIQMSKIKNNGYTPVDSYRLIYKQGNISGGSAQDYVQGKIKYDECLSYLHSASSGYFSDKRYLYEYDAKGRVLKYTIQRANSGTPVMINEEMQIHTYNAAGTEELIYVLQWKQNKSEWDTTHRWSYTYDVAGNMLSWEEWKPTTGTGTGWRGVQRHVNSYDGNRLESTLSYFWKTTINDFDSTARKYYIYNAFGLIDTQLTKGYVGVGVWADQALSVFTYNSANLETLNLLMGKSALNAPWVGYYQTLSYYDAQNRITNKDYKQWSIPQNKWSDVFRDTFEVLSTNPKVIRETRKDPDYINGGFLNSWLTTRACDAKGRWISWTDSTWNDVTQQWELAYNDERTVFHYGQGLNVNNTIKDEIDLNIYPNPATNYISLQLPTPQSQAYVVSIHNTSGQLVGQQQIPKGIATLTIPVAHLAAGTYTLTLQSNTEKTATLFSIVK